MDESALENISRRRLDELSQEFIGWLPQKRDVERVRRGSRLELDDRAFPLFATSHVVEPLINSAREHLVALGLLWRSRDGTYLLPRSYSTLLRASLLASATATWILLPDDRGLRVQRSLMVAIADIENAIAANNTIATSRYADSLLSPDDQEAARADMAKHAENLDKVRRKLWELAGDSAPYSERKVRDLQRRLYSSTQAVKEAFAALHPDNAAKQLSGSLYWSMMSGDSHGYRWQVLTRGGHTGERQKARAQVGDTVRFVDVTTCTFLMPQVSAVREAYSQAEDLWNGSATSAPNVLGTPGRQRPSHQGAPHRS